MHGQAGAQDTIDVLALMTQLMTRFKDSMLQLVEAMLPPIVARVSALLGPDWDWSGRQAAPALPGAAAAGSGGAQQAAAPAQQAVGGGGRAGGQQRGGEGEGGEGRGQAGDVAATLEDAREKGELQRAYYSFLHGLAHNGLALALLQAPTSVLDSVLSSLTKGAATHVDPTVRRTCLQVGGFGGGEVSRVWVAGGWVAFLHAYNLFGRKEDVPARQGMFFLWGALLRNFVRVGFERATRTWRARNMCAPACVRACARFGKLGCSGE